MLRGAALDILHVIHFQERQTMMKSLNSLRCDSAPGTVVPVTKNRLQKPNKILQALEAG